MWISPTETEAPVFCQYLGMKFSLWRGTDIQEHVRLGDRRRDIVVRVFCLVDHRQWVAILSDIQLVARVAITIGELRKTHNGQQKEREDEGKHLENRNDV